MGSVDVRAKKVRYPVDVLALSVTEALWESEMAGDWSELLPTAPVEVTTVQAPVPVPVLHPEGREVPFSKLSSAVTKAGYWVSG
jgi:hypothetical protein